MGERPALVTSDTDRGASLVEFALTMPLLLLIIFGIAEFGRLIAVASEVETASQNAVLYAVSGGESINGIPRYADCQAIRAAAHGSTALVQPSELTVRISYDHGAGTAEFLDCPLGSPSAAELLGAGDRIAVTVTADFLLDIPFVSDLIGPTTLTSSHLRKLPSP